MLGRKGMIISLKIWSCALHMTTLMENMTELIRLGCFTHKSEV